MHLLSPDEVKKESVESTEERKKRAQSLSDEESRLTRELNLIRSQAEKEKKKIKEDTDAFVAEQTLRRNAIKSEVDKLESRRADALKPIDEVQKEAEKRLEAALKKETDVAKREDELGAAIQDIAEKAQNVIDHEEENESRAKELDRREANIKAVEKRLSESTNKLSQGWTEYHAAVHIANKELKRRENEVSAKEKANEIRTRELEKQAETQHAENRAIADKYRALEQAKKHLGIHG